MLSEMILMCGIEDLATRSEAWLFLGRTRLRRNAQVKLGMKPFVASSFLPGHARRKPIRTIGTKRDVCCLHKVVALLIALTQLVLRPKQLNLNCVHHVHLLVPVKTL